MVRIDKNIVVKFADDDIREVLKEQILAIRNSGQINMFDYSAVARLALKKNFFELLCFVSWNLDQYLDFIASGDENLLPE